MTSPASQPRQTVVLGLGNPVRYDDAVGLRVAEAVERLLAEQPVPGVTVMTSTRAGFELIDLLSGASRAIIVDCLVPPDPVPGRIRRLTLEDVAGAARLVGAHDITLAGAFDLARATGVPMPGPVEIYAVEAADIDRLEEGLSPAVASAVPRLAREIHRRLAGCRETHPLGPGLTT
jgi:hydrogenase maturation protease